MVRLRYVLIAFFGLHLSAQSAFCQTESPRELRARARALTLADLSERMEQAKLGDDESRVIVGLGLQILAERRRHLDHATEMDKLAASWYREAAQKGYAPAQYFLAAKIFQYDGGYSAPSDCDQALSWLNKAIAQDYVPAITLKGWLHTEGPCNMADYRLGIELLKKAAERGDARACFWLGKIHYLQGYTGAAITEAEAVKYYVKGAQLGDSDSQAMVGTWVLEASGAAPKSSRNVPKGFKELIGVKPSVAGALEWLQKAAEQGNRDGACGLAGIYMEGWGVPKDYVTSLMWGLIADRHATEIGCLSEGFSDLVKMTREQNSEATRRANVWLKAHNFPTVPPQYLKFSDERPKPE